MKYIDAATAAEIISDKLNIPLDDLCDIFEEIPSEDVQPVKHGKWEVRTQKDGTTIGQHSVTYCSECGYVIFTKENSFCARCGARMDGDSE